MITAIISIIVQVWALGLCLGIAWGVAFSTTIPNRQLPYFSVIFFPLEVIFHPRVTVGGCPVATDCIVAAIRATTTPRRGVLIAGDPEIIFSNCFSFYFLRRRLMLYTRYEVPTVLYQVCIFHSEVKVDATYVRLLFSYRCLSIVGPSLSGTPRALPCMHECMYVCGFRHAAGDLFFRFR